MIDINQLQQDLDSGNFLPENGWEGTVRDLIAEVRRLDADLIEATGDEFAFMRMQDDLSELLALNVELVEALRPFADAYNNADDHNILYVKVTPSDMFEHAAAALRRYEETQS